MAQIMLTVNGRSYPVACDDGQEERIRQLESRVVQSRDRRDQRQAEPRPRQTRAARQTAKALRRELAVLGRYARTGVADLEPRVRARAREHDADRRSAAVLERQHSDPEAFISANRARVGSLHRKSGARFSTNLQPRLVQALDIMFDKFVVKPLREFLASGRREIRPDGEQFLHCFLRVFVLTQLREPSGACGRSPEIAWHVDSQSGVR